MTDHNWLRLLEVIRRELGAKDAFVQIGGEPPTDPCWIVTALEGERRLVAVMEEPPANPDMAQRRLDALRDALCATTVSSSEAPGPTSASRSSLDHALADLASLARAESALVFDIDTPVVWGWSAVDGREIDLVQIEESAEVDLAVRQAGLKWDTLLDRDVDATLAALHAGLPESEAGSATRVVERLHRLWLEQGRHAVHRRLRIARAMRAVRKRQRRASDTPTELTLREPDVNCVLREFATIYRLLLVFEDGFSPLHAEAALQRGLGHIEHLVLALPPIDPGGGKAKAARVLRLV